MSLKEIIKPGRQAMSVSYGRETKMQIDRLSLKLRRKKVKAVEFLFDSVLNNESSREQFTKFSETIQSAKLSAPRKSAPAEGSDEPTIILSEYHSSFQISTKLYVQLNNDMYSFGFHDRNSFFRAVIHFSYENYFGLEKQQMLDEFLANLKKAGFSAVAGIYIDNEFVVRFPVSK